MSTIKSSQKVAKTKAQNRLKQRQRRTLTFLRMCRYGVNNFSRNAWLTIAATAVMSVTLLIIFMTLVARNVLIQTADDTSKKIDISIYLDNNSPEEEIMKLKERVEKLDNVESVRYISAAQAREDQAKKYKQKTGTLEAIREAVNKLPATLRVNLEDVNITKSLDEFIQRDDLYKKLRDKTKDPSFQGERRDAIKTIGEWAKLAEIGGGLAAMVFIVISSLVVFNTIRMAIFNRKDEIQMMKLIGAERGFIRGPFLVEAVMYGFLAAIIATAAGYTLVFAAKQPMAQYGIPVEPTVQWLLSYLGVVLLGMIGIGALIGTVSSFIATRKYLKV